MTNTDRSLCDCPDPCGCNAADKDRVYFEVLAGVDGPSHAEGCACLACQVKTATLRKMLTLMARSSPALFELVEAWAVEDHTNLQGERQGQVFLSSKCTASTYSGTLDPLRR